MSLQANGLERKLLESTDLWLQLCSGRWTAARRNCARLSGSIGALVEAAPSTTIRNAQSDSPTGLFNSNEVKSLSSRLR